MKFYILNGPNLNLLGVREPQKYGSTSYEELCKSVKAFCDEAKIEVEFYQSNHEGALVDKIQEGYFKKIDGIVFNPGAYTHTSIALLDALLAVKIPCVEVHITNPDEREDFRHVSYVRSACVGTVRGHGIGGYTEGCQMLIDYLKKA